MAADEAARGPSTQRNLPPQESSQAADYYGGLPTAAPQDTAPAVPGYGSYYAPETTQAEQDGYARFADQRSKIRGDFLTATASLMTMMKTDISKRIDEAYKKEYNIKFDIIQALNYFKTPSALNEASGVKSIAKGISRVFTGRSNNLTRPEYIKDRDAVVTRMLDQIFSIKNNWLSLATEGYTYASQIVGLNARMLGLDPNTTPFKAQVTAIDTAYKQMITGWMCKLSDDKRKELVDKAKAVNNQHTEATYVSTVIPTIACQKGGRKTRRRRGRKYRKTRKA